MATTITPTRITPVAQVGEGGWYEAMYECTADTTTAAGLLTMDLTDDFSYVYGLEFIGFKAAEAEEILKPLTPGYDVAIDATNVGVYVYDATGASIDSTSVATALGTFYVHVRGKRALT
jgi:hypothetical protein